MYNVLCILLVVYTLAQCLYIYTTLKELYMVLYSPSYGLTLAAWFLPRKQPRSFCSMRLLQFGTNIGLEHKRQYTTNFLVCGILNEIKKQESMCSISLLLQNHYMISLCCSNSFQRIIFGYKYKVVGANIYLRFFI